MTTVGNSRLYVKLLYDLKVCTCSTVLDDVQNLVETVESSNLLENCHRLFRDIIEIVSGKRQNGRSCSRKANAQKTVIFLWGDGRKNIWQTRDLFGASEYNIANPCSMNHVKSLTKVFLYG
jgi:hypothetical protein